MKLGAAETTVPMKTAPGSWTSLHAERRRSHLQANMGAASRMSVPFSTFVKVLVGALVATPPLSVTALPKVTPSMKNCTVPAGVAPVRSVLVTVAVNVTSCPDTVGLPDPTIAVAVAYLFVNTKVAVIAPTTAVTL